MVKTLGLDLGTSSLGWAIVERDENDNITLLEHGVDIFQEGVAREKNIESPAVQPRTEARASRRHYFRRRLRKIELLKVLIANGLCPYVSGEQLDMWRYKRVYPLTDDFIRWQRTDDNIGKNPYHDRYRALTETLNPEVQADRYTLGRALYHLVQRRGFLSNRKEASNSEDGVVKQNIKELNEEIAKSGCKYLGEYLYHCYKSGVKIRTRHTSREHLRTELEAICQRQNLSSELRRSLERAILFQRPLKSQKGQVGKCTFERDKSRCPISHPRFEEFRMLQFVNNIRVTDLTGVERALSTEEKEKIAPLFFRKSKAHFDFEDIAKKIAGKGNYACKDYGKEVAYRFNYSATTTVSGCPVTAKLREIFGEEYPASACEVYTLGAGKSGKEIENDIWHALFSFDDEERLCEWAKEKLQLSDEDAKSFADIHMQQGYANLSLNAIDKMLPFLRRGFRYDEAVFLANLRAVLPAEVWSDEVSRNNIEEDIAGIIRNYRRNEYDKYDSKERRIEHYFADNGIDMSRIDRLYHPSMIETYKKAEYGERDYLQLGSPRTSSVRNPMAMRALFRLRALVNKLLRDGKIDCDTKINIEFARGLNDANRRKAIEQYQRDRDKEHQSDADAIRQLYKAETGLEIEPTDTDILKYRLWKEQQHICLYTGKTIGIADFIGPNTTFDIEHTAPRSRGGDDSQMNKTLCESRFNRFVKKGKLPAELSNYDEIMARIESLGWQKMLDSLQGQIEGLRRRSAAASTKAERDAAIQRRHLLQMQLDDVKGKLDRFRMTEIPEGFSNRQGVDIGIIGRYARLYLKTVFEKIYTVKGATTSAFRTMWGLQEEYSKKERVNHAHHCIDAVTIACIGRKEYDRWAQYMADEERYLRGEEAKPRFDKPWPTFTEDVKAIADSLLVSHHTADNMPKQSRKLLRVRGKVQRNADGKPIYVTGDTARASLHMQTFYGAIKRDEEIKYVVRKSLGSLQPADIDKIVDDVVREKVKRAIAEVGFKQAVSNDYTIWMNEERGIPIRKVRIFTPSVTNPIHLKKQRDLSVKEYKQDYHVTNDGNYCMAVYEGVDAKGRVKRSFEIVSNLEAAKFFKPSADKESRPDLVPVADGNGYPLKCVLKSGTMVLFYENTPEELYDATRQELTKRLYKVTSMSISTIQQKYTYGIIILKHQQEARPGVELSVKKGVWKINEEYRPIIGLQHTQLNAFVEGYDFDLTVTGEIVFKNR